MKKEKKKKRKKEYNVVFNLLWKTNRLLVRTKYFNPGTSRAVVCTGLYVFICIKFVYYILLVFLAVCRTVIGQLDFTKTSWPYLIYSHCFMYDILLSLSSLLSLYQTLSLTLSLRGHLPTFIFNLMWVVIINALHVVARILMSTKNLILFESSSINFHMVVIIFIMDE